MVRILNIYTIEIWLKKNPRLGIKRQFRVPIPYSCRITNSKMDAKTENEYFPSGYYKFSIFQLINVACVVLNCICYVVRYKITMFKVLKFSIWKKIVFRSSWTGFLPCEVEVKYMLWFSVIKCSKSCNIGYI